MALVLINRIIFQKVCVRNNIMAYPWHSTSAQDWKKALVDNNLSTQAIAELFAQATARFRQLDIRTNLLRKIVSLNSLFVPGAVDSRCVLCKIPCVVDAAGEALHLAPCGHLIHAFCATVQSTCPQCNVVVQPPPKQPSSEIEAAWLNLEASYRISQSDQALGMCRTLLHGLVNEEEMTTGIPTYKLLWDSREDFEDPVACIPATARIQTFCTDGWTARMDDYRARAKVMLERYGSEIKDTAHLQDHVSVAPLQRIPAPESSLLDQPPTFVKTPAPGTSYYVPSAQTSQASAGYKVTRGNFKSKSGATKFFGMLSKFQGKFPCPKCNKHFVPHVDYICKPSNNQSKEWYCVKCATGYTNEEMPQILATCSQDDDDTPSSLVTDHLNQPDVEPQAKRHKTGYTPSVMSMFTIS